MAKGTWVKAVVLIIISAMIFGACSSTAVHEQIWDNLKALLGDTVPGGDDDNGTETYITYPYSTSFNVSQTIYVNVTDGTLESLYYRSPLPDDAWNESHVQTVVWNNTGMQDDFDTDYSVPGWANLTYNGADISAPGSLTFTITYNATSEFRMWNLTAEECAGNDSIPAEYGRYLTDEEWTADNATVGINMSQAATAVGEAFNGTETDVLTILHKAYAWVVENIEYYTDGGRLNSVSETLASGQGDCDDMSTLLVSMARQQGAAAWLVQGILYDNGTGEWQHHTWVQAYVPLNNGSYVNITIDPSNQQFAVFTPNRLIVYTDISGSATRMGEYYNYIGAGGPGISGQVNLEIETGYYQSYGTVNVPLSHMTW